MEIRLSRRCLANKLIWVSDKLGHFTVRLAYNMTKVVLGKEKLRMEYRSPIWKILWIAKIMPKVKYFTQRLLWGILPTSDNLLRRRLTIDHNCQICVDQNESLFHVMFECRLSRQVWIECCPWVLEVIQDILSEGNIFEKLFIKAYQQKQVEVVCMTLWLLQFNRNRVVHDHLC